MSVTEVTSDAAATRPQVAESSPPQRTLLHRVLRSRVTGLALFDIAFVVLISAIQPDFLRWDNFRVIFENTALTAIVMVAAVYLLAAGRFDLSVDGIAVLCGIVAGLMMTDFGLPGPVAFAIGLAVGCVIGLANGLLIEVAGLNPLVATLGTWWITVGTALGLTGGQSPFAFPNSFTALGHTRFLGMLIPVWYAVFFLPIMGVVLGFTRFGAHVYATGGDREAAHLNGVKVKQIGVLLYLMSGGLAAVAGVVFAARLSSASPSAFDGMALDIIAAAVIGGASLSGGRGTVLGGLLGLLLLNLFGSAASYVGISPYWQKAISGGVLLVALAADMIARHRQAREPVVRPQPRSRLLDLLRRGGSTAASRSKT